MTTQTPLTVPSRDSRPRRARVGATLVLEDGRTFRGASYGALGETVGEAVFSTGMTGYQETLTDPSYHRQVIVMTVAARRQHRRQHRGRREHPHLGRRLRRARPRDPLLELARHA